MRFVWLSLILALAASLGWNLYQRLATTDADTTQSRDRQPVPVQVAAVERGSIALLRTFTGTLEAAAGFVVAPKVSGRVERLDVDLADSVTRGQVIAVLDDAEYVQAVARAQADLEVERASNAEALSLLKIAERELKRIEELQSRGVSSESQRDAAKADQLAKQARVAVTKARIARAEADLEAARIRLGYTQVSANWRGGSETRVVAERFVDEGVTLAANAPLMRIVELDPIIGVFFVTERDYARMRIGQTARLTTDAFPGESFPGTILRIAPVFREATRQARVELRLPNPDLRLKPGMFVRASVVLEQVQDVVIVPEPALLTRDGHRGVFLLSPDGRSAQWRKVQVGIQQGERVEVRGENLAGQVVVLGQQLLDDGSPVRVASEAGLASP